MFTLPRLTARLAVIASFAALLAAACNPDSKDPSAALFSPLSANRQGGGGAAPGFAVLANQAVTCTNGTITGDVGTRQAPPTGSVTQTICPVTGTVHVGDAAAVQAYNGFLSTYASVATTPCDVVLTGTLAGVTLAPGVYCFDAAATLTGRHDAFLAAGEAALTTCAVAGEEFVEHRCGASAAGLGAQGGHPSRARPRHA